MNRENRSDSPIEAVIGGEGGQVSAAFELLGNENRVAILLALWDAYEPQGRHEVPLTFSELRQRVNLSDSGQFNYHLEKLVGTFVRNIDDGYVLSSAGHSIVEAVIAGAGIEDASLDAKEVESPCPLCGSRTAIGYDNERLFRVCTECPGYARTSGWLAEATDGYGGVLFIAEFEPAGLTDRTPMEIYEANVIGASLETAMMMTGVCAECSGRVESSIESCDNHVGSDTEVCPNCGTRWGFNPVLACTVCKHHVTPPPAFPANFHPAVIDFYSGHGIDLADLTDPKSFVRIQSLLRDQEAELVSTAPPRVRVTVRHDGASLRVTYDDDLTFTEIEPG